MAGSFSDMDREAIYIDARERSLGRVALHISPKPIYRNFFLRADGMILPYIGEKALYDGRGGPNAGGRGIHIGKSGIYSPPVRVSRYDTGTNS
jgi:hypothetical protein